MSLSLVVDCWDGQDGEPIVHHGYTLTSKILFKDVVETINKYAFVKNPYVYLIFNNSYHCLTIHREAGVCLHVLCFIIEQDKFTSKESLSFGDRM